MLKYFKPVFDYKLSFDPNKGESTRQKFITQFQRMEKLGSEKQFLTA